MQLFVSFWFEPKTSTFRSDSVHEALSYVIQERLFLFSW